MYVFVENIPVMEISRFHHGGGGSLSTADRLVVEPALPPGKFWKNHDKS